MSVHFVVITASLQKPRFYNLGPIDVNLQDAPKVDGLVCREQMLF